MIPLRDSIQSRTWPVVNLLLIGINLLVFLATLGLDDPQLQKFAESYAIVPVRFWYALQHPSFFPGQVATLFYAMFMHGGLMHLIGNMWFLWIFGDNVEDRLGHFRYLLFYLATGLIAAASELLLQPTGSIPILGASGAIAGVLGAYLWWYPAARVQVLLPIFIFFPIFEIPAIFFLGLWFLTQILGSLGGEGGVAWYAHIFGFVGGLLLSLMIQRPETVRRRAAPRRRVY